MTGNKLKQSVEIMHNLIYFFNNYVDDVFWKCRRLYFQRQ